MGVPKFFRWLSERYPLINQPIHCPPDEETKKEHGYPASIVEDVSGEDESSALKQDSRKNTDLPHIMPEFDRLYLDMNGIIHCASHNNSSDMELDKPHPGESNGGESGDGDTSTSSISPGVPPITEEQIFQNVRYYVDRVVGDIVKPKKLVFLAIDGVAPRAKLNQQRSRRYRSGTEQEIEMHLMTLQRVNKLDSAAGIEDDDELKREYLIEADGGAFGGGGYRAAGDSDKPRGAQRFSGTIDTKSSSKASISASSGGAVLTEDGVPGFHSNCITPGTSFLHRCSENIVEWIKHKLQTDPQWKDLTIVFSGHDVPGEGEHKIMDFIRHEKHKVGYDPNTSHCIFGQDGDLMMLGLATHEPHTCLLREEVVFDPAKKRAMENIARAEHGKHLAEINDLGGTIPNDYKPPLSAAVQSYIFNANFELLHISVLREYLGLEFETKEFYPKSRFELEPTIDDFVFMTFFVGNDFLPHMPALDIGDEAFDLLFYAYKKNRTKWLRDGLHRRVVLTDEFDKHGVRKRKTTNHPYLTDAGKITSGTRLEGFLEDVGGYEDPYYQNKKEFLEEENERMRKQDAKAGRESLIPSPDILEQVEMASQELYAEMLKEKALSEDEQSALSYDDEDDSFKPVTSNAVPDAELITKLGQNFRGSLSPNEGGVAKVDETNDGRSNLSDLKGRYYYDKFGYSPFDQEKHLALRKAYIEGLVWNLEYYMKGVPSWEWYYPYNYGPMISDLVNVNQLLSEVSFIEDGDGKAAGSSSNAEEEEEGSRVVAGEPLRPFEQLLGCLPPSSSYLLPEPYRWLMTSPDSPLIEFFPESFAVDMNGKRWPWEAVTLLPFIDSKKLVDAARAVDTSTLTEDERRLNEFGKSYVFSRQNDTVEMELLDEHDANVAFQPQLHPDTQTPGDCFPSLKDAPIKKLNRRKVFLNVFGLKSRYRTALLEMDDKLPAFPPTKLLAQKFIGTTVHFRYPILHEGFVCSVSDATTMYRGNAKPHKFSKATQMKRPALLNKMFKGLQIGEGMTGTGGWIVPQSDITLTVRPLEGVETLPDGTKAKVYAKSEVELPFVAALFSPSRRDPRLEIPAKLEKDPFIYGARPSSPDINVDIEKDNGSLKKAIGKLEGLADINGIGTKKITAAGSSRGFAALSAAKSPHQPGTRPPTKNLSPPRRTFHSAACKMAHRGGPRHKIVCTAGAMAMSAFFFAACVVQVNAITNSIFPIKTLARDPTPGRNSDLYLESALSLRGGEFTDIITDKSPTPPIDFAHGTTTISFVFQGGIVAAVDSRASIGNFVGSKTTQKVLPVSKHILGTMAGGAADCSYWIRFLRSEAKMHELLHDGRGISVARASRVISNILYQNRGLDLSVGTMIMGWNPRGGFKIYYVDNSGIRVEGDMFAVGSGSTFALGILDTEERRFDMSEEEAVSLGIKAIRHATLRDAMSGGYIGVYLITKDGWRKVFSEDLASISA